MLQETIVALATPPGAAPRAVIRLSGGSAHRLALTVFRPSEAWRCYRRVTGELAIGGASPWPRVPAAAYVFRNPRSYTREDMVELHIVGSPPLISASIAALARAGARAAEPGEFTRRAFLNGRIDLTQAEAVLAMTSAEQRGAVRLAARTLRGGLGECIDGVKNDLLSLGAFIEAAIDFSEDEIDLLPVERVLERLASAASTLRKLLRRTARFNLTRSEPIVALHGPANAGKSTLFNALAGSQRAITSELAGTTRDVVSARINLAGRPIELLDLAGKQVARDAIELGAQRHAAEAISGADLIVHVLDAQLKTLPPQVPGEILVLNKRDALSPARIQELEDQGYRIISAEQGLGLRELEGEIVAALEQDQALRTESADYLASARQLSLIEATLVSLARAEETMRCCGEERWELAMVDLRACLGELGEITGAVGTEELLDLIFGRFCIGK